jgi:hypothetical protein
MGGAYEKTRVQLVFRRAFATNGVYKWILVLCDAASWKMQSNALPPNVIA